MIFRIHNPANVLSRHIENIVYYEGYSAEHFVDKLLPDGSIHLILDMENSPKKLYYNEEFTNYKEYSKAYVSGQHQGFIFIDARVSSMMVISFKIGGAYPFFDLPVSDLNDKVVHLQDYWGDAILSVREKIINEKDIDRKFLLIEEFLLSAKKEHRQNKALDTAIAQLLEEPDSTVKLLAEKAGVSQKHLISLFRQRVGLSPKILLRILRFQRVISQIGEQDKIDWTSTAHACGYYDQAHFIKDFYAFSGIKPSSYPDQRGEYTNYIPMK